MSKRTNIHVCVLKLVLSLVCLLPSLVSAQDVVRVSPLSNAINAPAGSVVNAEFAGNVDIATLDETTVIVYGSQTGYYNGAVSYNPSTRTLTYRTNTAFKEGEIVSVCLTDGIRIAGQPITSYQWQFTVAVEYGTGIFDTRIEVPAGANQPSAVFAADFNNDLFPDVAVANNPAGSVSILINELFTVSNTFQARDIISVGAAPVAITGGDFNNDGFIDLVVANSGDHTISVLQNDGAGNFSISQTINTGQNPVQLEICDFDNDGLFDIAATTMQSDRLELFFNSGSSFSSIPATYTTGSDPYGLTGGDFDNDGDIDIIVANSADNSIMVYHNDGTGQLTNGGEIAVPEFPTIVRSNDLFGRISTEYGDNFVDIVIVHPNSNSITIMDNRSLDGGFVITEQFSLGTRPSDVFVGDVDTTDAIAFASGFPKDYDIDVVVPNLLSQDIHLLRNEFNNGFGQSSGDIFAAGSSPVAITGSDFDRDGDVDLAVGNMNNSMVSILFNRGGAEELRLVSAELLDYGQVWIGSDSTMFVSLFNPSTENVVIDIPQSYGPVWSAPLQSLVPARGIYNMPVTFSPADTIAYFDSLTIQANIAGVIQQIPIQMRGAGIRSILAVTPDTLIFGNIQPPQISTLFINIENLGNSELDISNIDLPGTVFSIPVTRMTLPPYSNQRLDVTFAPPAPGAYVETLTITSNDSLNPDFPVLLLGGPNQFPPVLVSADTVIAMEDQPFSYTALATDADGTQPVFSYENLPGWLTVSPTDPATVQGTPAEGENDALITVIASDGLFHDSLQVFVQVMPVNDPPVISQIADQTVTELTSIALDFTASDPEDSTLTFTVLGLPPGASFTNNGNRTATFRWTPPFGSRGVYLVHFIVSEVYTSPALSDTATIRFTVLEARSDLVTLSLDINNTDITLNQSRRLTGVIRAEDAPVVNPFRVTFFHNGAVAVDTVLAGLNVGEQFTMIYDATFDQLGDHVIRFEVDADNNIPESDEDNNFLILRLKVSKGELAVRPNPFTPNNDGFNDNAVFDFSDLVLARPELKIFDFRGGLLTTLREPGDSAFQWDGRDERGREQQPGVYLFVLMDETERVTTGYVVLAR